jgi:acetyl-CoA carboxylase biotin carboxyl carrier protein
MSLSTQQIREILAIIEGSGWDEAQITVGDTTIHVSKDGGAPVVVASIAVPEPAPVLPPAPSPTAAVGGNGSGPAGTTVPSPVLGMFWRAPEPGAPPFVDVGSTVAAGDTLCIVEVMKLMNHIACETPGKIVAVHPTNGDMVEAGAPLFTIEAAATT